ncbi:MAG TPA: PAS domain S-box protein [Spirochaetia bacterium]|nr:PAS domain S-box protein [Spirochaetia bacterium]
MKKGDEKTDLAATPELLGAIMDAAIDAIIAMGPDGRVTASNAAAERIFGYSSGEIVGKKLHQLLAPERVHKDFERASPAFQRNGIGPAINKTSELDAVRKDGTVFPVELSLSAFAREDGWHAVGVLRDVTARKAGERAARQNEQRLQDWFEEMPIGLYRTDPAGAILDANRAMVALFGFPDKASMLRINVAELYVDRVQREVFHREIELTGTVRDMQGRLRRRDGTEISVLISARLVRDEDGSIKWFEGSLQDISGRLKADTEKKRAERLEVIGQLAAGIAHDFNNILAGIRGFAEYLALKKHADPAVTAAGERIVLAMNRASRIADGLLNILGTEVHSPARIRVEDFVRRALDRLSSIQGKGVHIDSEISCGDLEVNADRERLEAALDALIDNAVLASAEGGRVVVRADLGHVEPAWAFAPQGELNGIWARLSVTDQGCGMDETTLDRIFEPYFTTRGFGTGAGLGLTRVLGIARQHGGFIAVSSHPGQGTNATIYLPL